MPRKIGLVIQGPLISIGRSGNNLHLSPEKLKETGGVIHFDCRDNIRRIISEFGHLFDKIVVSTWENEIRPGESFSGAEIVAVPDPGGIKWQNHYKDNNKFRQFLSTLNGLKRLEAEGVEFAVKTRTDTYLDFGKLVEDFFGQEQKSQGVPKIFATVAAPQPYMLHDLYFASHTRALIDFCEAILAFDRFEFVSSVHREMVLKHAYSCYRREIGAPEWAYFPFYPPLGAPRETNRIFEFMFDNIYRNLDSSIFRGTEWRGSRYEEAYVADLVAKSGKRPVYRDIPALISIDWSRYFFFRELQGGARAGMGEKTKAVVGRWCWYGWGKFRNFVRKAQGF